MAALDLPPIPLGLPPADPSVAEAQAQQRRLTAQQTEQQQAQAQLQRTGLENQAAGNAQLAKTAAADAAQWGVNGYAGADNKGAAFGAQPPEFRQHMADAYAPIADQIPGIVNQTQRNITGNPDVGIPTAPAGAIEQRTVDPTGRVHRSYQFDTATPVNGDASDPLSGLPPQEAQMAKQLAGYQLSPNVLSRLQGQQKLRILNAAAAVNPDFDEKQYPIRQSALKSFTSGPDAANIASANTVVGHINDFLKAGEDLHNRGGILTPWNIVSNAYEGATGNPAQTTFASKSTAIADEMAKLFKGTGAATDSSIRDWKATLSPNMSPEQIRASAQSAMELMASRLSALQEKYRNGLGKDPERPFLSPRSQAILRTNGLTIPTGQEEAQTQPATPQLTPQDQAAIEWANANPNDPRANSIKALHGVK